MSEWTTDTLRTYVLDLFKEMIARQDERFVEADKRYAASFAAQDKAVAAALASAKEAVNKAEAASEKRFDSANEFRGQLSDQARSFMPRIEAEIRFNALDQSLAAISSREQMAQGRSAGANASWGYVVGAIGVVGALVGIVLSVLD